MPAFRLLLRCPRGPPIRKPSFGFLRRSPVCRFTSSDSHPTKSSPPTSAYIHLPFCRKRCHYCDFPIVALGSSCDDHDTRISNYISLLLREIDVTKPARDDANMPPIETVYFGGGTPSLVPPNFVAMVLDALRSKFGLSECPEVSMEMDPGTFDRAKLRDFLELGVNRVSLGVQAFQDELLQSCGRAHGLKEVEEAIDVLSECDGLENWSLDLISSLPFQTMDMWEQSLQRAVDAGPTHISVYDLQVEQGTKFGLLYTPGEYPLPAESESANLYRKATRKLSEAGYDHYEISSYCRPGFECKHNLTYWQNRSYYGFGLGSASYTGGIRFSRPKRLKEYTEWVRSLGDGLIEFNANVAKMDMALDVVMLSLRTSAGLNLLKFSESFGAHLARSLCEAFAPFVDSGHVVPMSTERRALRASAFKSMMTMVNGEDGCLKVGEDGVAFIRLSDPDGFMLSNELISVAFRVISP